MAGISRSPTTTSCEVRVVSYRINTCFAFGASARAESTWMNASTTTSHQHARVSTERLRMAVSEGQLGRQFEEPWRQDAVGLRPESAGDERAVVRERDARIECVVCLDGHERLRATTLERLGDAQIELVDSITIQRTWRDEIYCHVRRVS